LIVLLPITKSILRCQQLTTLIQYLGLPLTIRKPPRTAFLPLISNVQGRCQGFANNHLSVVGRVVLTNSILNALPLHYMQAFLLPKGVTKTIQSITRRYLWQGTEPSFSGGHCLVAWRTMTLPKENGGLNIIDIRLQNKCLLLKWLWVAIKEPDSLWGSTGHGTLIFGRSFSSSLANDDIAKGKQGTKYHRHTPTKQVPATQMAMGGH
jgi:hypothetical protein